MALNVGGSDSLYWHTAINNQGLRTGATQAKGILAGLSKSITRMDVFAGLAIGSAFVFAKISKQAYNFSKEFETAMKEVQTISKAVQDDFKGISKEIITMSKTVPDNAQKLTKALYQIVSAGYDGAEAMKILRTSTELAVASVTDTFTAADALTYVMNAYGKAAGTAADISDKLFTIVRLGKVKMEELGPTISMVTGLAAEAGLSFNELSAMYAEAVKKIQPHIVSTGIRGIVTAMLRVSKGTGDAADAARELGIEFDISALKSKGFKQVLKDIIEATKGNEGALMRLFPNVRGLIGLLAVMTNEGESFNKTLNEIENSTGATSKAFKTMMETTDNQLAILKNNIMAKLKPLGDSLLKQMNDIAKGINIAMSGANDELSKLSRSYLELTDTLQRKQGRIDDLIKTIEGLRSKTELTKTETIELEAAERALGVYFPILGKAAEDAAGSIDVLTLAKEGTIDLSIKIMGLELEQAKIEMRRADLAKELYDRKEDEGNKGINRIKKQIEAEKELTEFILTGGVEGLYKQEQLNDMMGIRLRDNVEYLKLTNELSLATEKMALEEDQLILNQEKSRIEVDALTDSLENLRKTREKPIITTPKTEAGRPIEEPTIIPTLTDEQIKAVEENLKYMASQHKRYLSDVAQFGEEYVEEHNTQLAKDGENYAEYLDTMLEMYAENADLTKEIMDDIYEYNKEITAKKKEAEEEYFNYIAEAREKDLKSEENKFKTIVKYYKEGSTEYLEAVEKHNKNVLEVNGKYDKEIAEAKLIIFKDSLEKQIGELDKSYKLRLEIAKTTLGKETKENEKYFKFVNGKLQEIVKTEKKISEEKERILQSYLKTYQTTEEKIASIHERTAELLKITDNEYERSKLKSIEKQLIAAVKFNKARQEITDKNAEYGEKLNNEELENYIEFLKEMKLKYSDFADIVILLNEKIAESQKQIWENVRDEIDKTVSALHALAGVVGNFDTELEEMINSMADLVSGIGQITIGFSTGNISGIISGIATAINGIINLFVQHKSDVPELKKELQEITLELQKQQTILSQSIGTAKTEAIQDTIDLLKEQIAVYNEMIEAEQEAYGQFLWWTWDETNQEAIEEWLSAIENANQAIADLNQQYQQILTGTTAETIADAIAEGFSQGLDSAQVFADTFNDMMKKAIIDAFKRTIVTRYIGRWYEMFANLSEGGLTIEEIDHLALVYQDIINAAENQWEAIQGILGTLGMNDVTDIQNDIAANITGLTGAIAGITEETAGLLAGQFQAIRINTVDILSNMESIIIINSRIAENTEYNRYLEDISNKLGTGNSSENEYLRAVGGV